ncbi:MAG: VanZ family protein [Georgenia sp.]
MSTSPAARRAAAALLVLAVAAQLVVLYAPRVPPLPGSAVTGLDKLVHAAVFAAVTVAAVRAGLPPAPVVGYGLVHAVVSELVQHLVLSGRSGDPLDVLADVAGVAVGVWLATRVLPAGGLGRAVLRRGGRGRTGPGRRGPDRSARRRTRRR